jgi:hypothetical protein
MLKKYRAISGKSHSFLIIILTIYNGSYEDRSNFIETPFQD